MTEKLRRELSAAARSTYWSEAVGRAVVAAWRASGDSAAGFGRRHGLAPRRLRWWGCRLGTSPVSRAETANTSVELIPIELIQRDDERGAMIEIAVRDYKVRVARDVEPDTLRTVIEVLRTC